MVTTNVNVHVVSELKQAAETMAALAEYDEMKRNPESYKRYSSFDTLMDEVLTDACDYTFQTN